MIPTTSPPGYINLSDLCDNSDDERELMEEEYPESKDDPLNNIDLQDFLTVLYLPHSVLFSRTLHRPLFPSTLSRCCSVMHSWSLHLHALGVTK